ncbi:MAG: hypothetical protein AVDCRST_MAG73-2360, partial [uncultured Thermomicrobiales bacterium]
CTITTNLCPTASTSSPAKAASSRSRWANAPSSRRPKPAASRRKTRSRGCWRICSRL